MVRHLTERTQRGGFYTGRQPIFLAVKNANGSGLAVVHKLSTGMSISDFERAYEQEFDYFSTKAEAFEVAKEYNRKSAGRKEVNLESYRKSTLPVPIRYRDGRVRLTHPLQP